MRIREMVVERDGGVDSVDGGIGGAGDDVLLGIIEEDGEHTGGIIGAEGVPDHHSAVDSQDLSLRILMGLARLILQSLITRMTMMPALE
jgi:hypothetical protein